MVGGTGHKQTICESPDLAEAQKAYVCFSLSHSRNKSKIFLGGPLQPRAAMYSRFISAVSAARQPSLIREMTQVLKMPPNNHPLLRSLPRLRQK